METDSFMPEINQKSREIDFKRSITNVP